MMRRPRLTPEMAKLRSAVQQALQLLAPNAVPKKGEETVEYLDADNPLILVGLSGGADSLALSAAVAFVAPRLGFRAGVVIVDHQLQDGSAEVAEKAAETARALNLSPVIIKGVTVEDGEGGLEALARDARYAAFDEAMAETGAVRTLLAHTLDDQAETVFLGLTRGSGPKALRGMPVDNGKILRPFLHIRRTETVAACENQNLAYWSDPHNEDERFLRVKIRKNVLPDIQSALGDHIPEALAKTARLLQEDEDYLEAVAEQKFREQVQISPGGTSASLMVEVLVAEHPALRHRLIRKTLQDVFGVAISFEQTQAVAELITNWRGQQRIELPGVWVRRKDGQLIFHTTPDES